MSDSTPPDNPELTLPEGFKLSVVIPAYNEADTLPPLLEAVQAVPIPKEIIIVDDGSTDGTREFLKSIEQQSCGDSDDVTVVHFQEQNQGKGAAVIAGFQRAIGDVVIVQDADLEYDPNEYPRLLQLILTGEADVVFGSRFLGDSKRQTLSRLQRVGNRTLTFLSNLFTGLKLTDMETCYKVFRKEALDSVLPLLREKRFGFEPEITAKLARRKFRIVEIPISYQSRDYTAGKKIGWKDGVSAMWCIVRYGLAD